MADLSMPPDLSDEERIAWLRRTGEALVEQTGLPDGEIDQEVEGEQPVWGIWWTDRDEAPDRPAQPPGH